MDIRAKQKAAIQRMLNLNADQKASPNQYQATWKVLVYDKYCQEMLSPLMNVSELRGLGITLHMLITQRRERVSDVPAVYFVRPTAENIDLICKDCAANLYDSFYLNFSSSIPRPLLEQLARANITTKTVTKIAQVHDQYTEFVALEPSLLTLNAPNSYFQLHNPADEPRLLSFVDEIVDALFSVTVTWACVPVIRCKEGHAAEMVAEKLSKRLFDHLRSRNNLFAGVESPLQRPVLVLVDRSMDLATPLKHAWTYQALCTDLLDFKSNRCTVPGEDGAKSKTYDMSSSDAFWCDNAGKIFPKVAEAVETSLKKYTKEVEAINNKTGVDPNAFDSFAGNTEDLASAINSLPELQRKKEVLDLHTITATAILRQLKRREIDAYFSLEEDVISKAALDKKSLAEQIGKTGKGTPRDKLRLLLIHYLCGDGADVDELAQALDWETQVAAAAPGEASTNDLAALNYLKQNQFLFKLESTGGQPMPQKQGQAKGGMFGSVMNSVYGQGAAGLTGLLAGVRNLLPTDSDLPLTKVVGNLMDNKPVERYAYFDPKSKSHKRIAGPQGRAAAPFRDALVFVLGGGNYSEYHNLRDYASKTSTPQATRSIGYASTELLSAEDFVAQLALLGSGQMPVD